MDGRTKTIAAAAAAGVGGWIGWKYLTARSRREPLLVPHQQIVIVGAGFGGMTAARTLATLLSADDDAQITLVDRNDFLLFTPMLTEIAGGELDGRHIVASPRKLSRRIAFERGIVRAIDVAARTVEFDGGLDRGNRKTLHADQLVIALGSVPNYHQVPGAREHSIAVKSVGDAMTIRNRVLRCLEAANLETDAAARRRLLTFVVAGGGFTGVETMGAINDLVRTTAGEYPNVRRDEITTVLVETGDRLLSELSPELAAYARQKLEGRGVQVQLKAKIKSVDADSVEIEPGGRNETKTLNWAAGVKPHPLVATLDCDKGRHGGIVVDECCAVRGRPGAWALGDCAEIPKARGAYAPTAQNATREGVLVAENVASVLRGDRPQPFRYEPVGELALIGRHTGVGQIYGYRFSGFVAWAMWRAIYVAKMPTLGQRCRIVLDWVLDGIFGRITADVPAGEASSR